MKVGQIPDSNVNSASSRWREAVTEWVHSPRLRALCTFELSDHLTVPCVEWDHDSSWTHKNSNKGLSSSWTTCSFLSKCKEKPVWYVVVTT